MSDMVRIYLMAGRKIWHHDVPNGWEEIAWERFDYVECAIFEKAAARLTDEDRKDWVEHYSKPPEGWIKPTLSQITHQ